MNKDIYSLFLEKAALTDDHKKDLQEKRGFSFETIERNKFRSGGEYLLKLEDEFSGFDKKALIKSGLFIKNGKTITLNNVLLEDRIIIPYLDRSGDPYFLRPHKKGLQDHGIRIYQELNLVGCDGRVGLTEGEFKAAAGQQYETMSMISVPGISSYSEKHFPRLVKVLNAYKAKEIVIIFDNEKKDDPSLPSYKDAPFKRYDTQFYAYYMAKCLEKEGFKTKIATLPEGWMENGKIDLDGAAAQKKTKEQIQNVIDMAVSHTDYLKEQPGEARNIILRKNKMKFFRSHVRTEFGRYVAFRKRGKLEYDEEISNFTLRILATHKTPEGIIREIVFVDEFGKYSASFSIDGNNMVTGDKFAAFAMSKGNYIWKGNRDDLSIIWEELFLNNDGRIIIEPDHIGYVESENIWIFGNVAISKDAELRTDKNHVFWKDKIGIKPVPLGVSSGRSTISEGIPYLNLSEFKIDDVLEKLADTIGEYEAKLCLGWVTSVLFMNEIFTDFGCFPFLFITGRRGSGKSTIAEWLMNFFGLENAGKMASDTTQVAIQRYLSYYSSLPVFIDEYRNTKDIVRKNGFLRNCYNRQSAGKGIKASFGVREARIRGTLVLAGEEMPEDNALLTRCIGIFIKHMQREHNHFNWFMKARLKFSNHTYLILKNKPALIDRFLKTLHEAKQHFSEAKDIDDRTAINYAVVVAGYYASFPRQDVNFASWVTEETARVKADQDAEQAIQVFYDDLLAMKTAEIIDDRYWTVNSSGICIYFSGLYNEWSIYYRKARGMEPFKRTAMLKYLKDEPGFIDAGYPTLLKSKTCKCVVFNKNNAPEDLKMLADVSEQMEIGLDDLE